MGGGLGGGSSNAAARPLALPVLAGVAVPMERLLCDRFRNWAADVPCFLNGGTQLELGRGGELYSLARYRATTPVLLVFPPVPVATGPAIRRAGP